MDEQGARLLIRSCISEYDEAGKKIEQFEKAVRTETKDINEEQAEQEQTSYNSEQELPLDQQDTEIEVEIQVIGGKEVVNSRQVAEDFGKEHKNITRDIEVIKDTLNFEQTSKLFIQADYKDSMNRTQKEYLLTRDGFSLVVMGFTGSKALQWKLKYIEAFNKMEAQLKGNSTAIMSMIGKMLEPIVLQSPIFKELQGQVQTLTNQLQNVTEQVQNLAVHPSEDWREQIEILKNKVTIARNASTSDKVKALWTESYDRLNNKLCINIYEEFRKYTKGYGSTNKIKYVESKEEYHKPYLEVWKEMFAEAMM